MKLSIDLTDEQTLDFALATGWTETVRAKDPKTNDEVEVKNPVTADEFVQNAIIDLISRPIHQKSIEIKTIERKKEDESLKPEIFVTSSK